MSSVTDNSLRHALRAKILPPGSEPGARGLSGVIEDARALAEGMEVEERELDRLFLYQTIHRWVTTETRGARSRPPGLVVWALSQAMGIDFYLIKKEMWPESAIWGEGPTTAGRGG